MDVKTDIRTRLPFLERYLSAKFMSDITHDQSTLWENVCACKKLSHCEITFYNTLISEMCKHYTKKAAIAREIGTKFSKKIDDESPDRDMLEDKEEILKFFLSFFPYMMEIHKQLEILPVDMANIVAGYI